MFSYQLRIAWLSLRRNPVLSSLLIGGIALGIAIATAFLSAFHVMSQDPIPSKSDRLFHVQMDSWAPDSSYSDERPEDPPTQLTYRDALAATSSEIPTYQSPMVKAHLTIHPANAEQRPFRAFTRVCASDFFHMFNVPFLYGAPWDRLADDEALTVIVLDYATNLRLFGGADSVGESVQVEDRSFAIVGVLAPWEPSTKFYDISHGAFGRPESMFIPFSLIEPMTIKTAGNTVSWTSPVGNSFEDFLSSESLWIQTWVQLDDPVQRNAYQSYLDAYTDEQRSLGRFGKPNNNRLRTVSEWLENQEVVPGEARAMLVISLLFLVVCSVNLIGILLGKFMARAPEVGVRRALGASRFSVFMQHVIECELIGVLGGAAGIGLSTLVLRVINRWMVGAGLDGYSLSLDMIVIGFALALVAGLIAGLYPSWRVCRVQPAFYLKQR